MMLLWVALSITPASTEGQTPIRIADSSVCRACRVVLDTVATLVAADSFSFKWETDVAATSVGFVAAPTYTLAQIGVFDRRGHFVRTFGRPGQGPGELSSDLLRLRIGPGDTLHIFDYSRWLLFAPGTCEFVRSVNLGVEPTAYSIVDSGENAGDLLAAYPSRAASGQLHTIHLISGKTGHVIRSYDAPEPAELRDALDSSRSVRWYDGRIWSLTRNRLSIRSEPLSGGMVQRWSRTDGWFPESLERSPGEPFIERPTPKAWDVRPSGDVIWVHATIADTDWQPVARSQRDPAVSRALRTADMNTLYDSVIEVFDAATGLVLTRFRSDAILGPVEGDPSLVHTKNVDDNGEITIHILRVSLYRDG